MNYIDLIGEFFPNVQAWCEGDPSNYDDVQVHENGDPLPSKEQLDIIDWANRQHLKWLEIRNERDRRYYQGVYLDGVDGNFYWFWTDLDTRSKYGMYDITIRSANLGPNVVLDNWKTMTGAFTPMTVQQLYRVIGAAVMNEKAIFNTAEAKNAEMMLLDDPDTYDNVYAGWPTCYSDTLTQA
jgi:hypothetical protein